MKRVFNFAKLVHRRKDLRNNPTIQETLLWARLKNYGVGVKFRRQHSIGSYIVDFYCPSKKLVVEIDGSQHHKVSAKEYDEIRTRIFQGLGIQVIRFTNKDINTNIEEVVNHITSML